MIARELPWHGGDQRRPALRQGLRELPDRVEVCLHVRWCVRDRNCGPKPVGHSMSSRAAMVDSDILAVDLHFPRFTVRGSRAFESGRRIIEKSARRCRIGAEVFVAGVSGSLVEVPRTTGDDPRCSTWFP
jgi:hypothetical protein